MKRKTIFALSTILTALFICTFVFTQAFDNSVDVEKTKKNLIDNDVGITKISIEKNVMQVTIKSNGIEKTTPEDIWAIRKIKNELRKPEYTDKIKNLSLMMVNKDGEVIFDKTYNDITTIPDFGEDKGLFISKLTDEDIQEKVQGLLSGEDYLQVEEIAIKSDINNRKIITLSCIFTDTDVSKINEVVREIMYDVKTMNSQDNAGICQYNLNIHSASKETLLALSNDLVYHDISWWQSPLLGNESWRGSGPEMKP